MADFTIRAAMVSDAAAISEIYRPYVENTAVTFEYTPPSAEEFEKRISAVLPFYPYIVAQSGGEIIGYCYSSPFHPRAAYRWAVETSIYVSSSFRRDGVGRALYEKMEEILKAQGFMDMYASITSKDAFDEYVTPASRRFHEKMGFYYIGTFKDTGFKFSRWYDVSWMGKRLAEHNENVKELRSFEEVKKNLGLD